MQRGSNGDTLESGQVGSEASTSEMASARPLWQTLTLLALLLFCTATFISLGLWQMHRLAWKRDLIETVDARVHAEPVAVPASSAWQTLDAAALAYQRVRLTGTFMQDAEAQALAVTELGGGYWVMTPLRLDTGGIVMINRGYVPQTLRDPASRSTSPPIARVQVTGLLRVSEPGGGFLRDNDPQTGRWYSRDTMAMADALGIRAPVAPFFVDVEANGMRLLDTDRDTDTEQSAFPRSGLTVIHFRNTHLSYALTWFTLAVLSLVGIWLVIREWRARANDKPDTTRQSD